MSASATSGGAMMPAVGAPKETKRRSRRGCIPCRKRHRKCDETKPACGSCLERRVDCIYKPLTWISDIHSQSAETKSKANSNARSSSSCLPSPTPAHVLSPSPTVPMGAEPQETTANTTTRVSIEGGSALAERRNELHVGLSATTPRDVSVSSRSERAVRLTNSGPVEPCRVAATLRSFIYDIAPLIDSSAPRSSFAVDVLELARTSDAISDALAVVVESRHTHPTHEIRHSLPEPLGALADLSTRDAFAARVGYALLSLSSFFGMCPSSWSTSRVHFPRDESPDLSLQSIKEPLQSLLRYQIKIELSTSLRTGRPLSEKLLSWVRLHPMSTPNSSPQIVYNASLCQLARCIDLINSRPSVFSKAPAERGTSDPSGEFESAWATQWALCTHWYQTRPPDMVPILETTALEAAALTTGGPGFPVSVHSSPISLQANVNMHLACLLLLKHKPGLSAATRPQQPLESRSWHSEKIAGSIVWNTFKEQWDPILLGALLSIAEDMTHRAQQVAIEDCLQRISRELGIDLRQEMTGLGRIWKAFQEDFDVDFDF